MVKDASIESKVTPEFLDLSLVISINDIPVMQGFWQGIRTAE
ncbi:hypothetical protein M7I_8287 [Glarea lozoyensis 74030]|uniref:Uncharacterized protein n=1 Tax=Glarea lozoyensis (strain ATCC 74030 / MF5533) TaxID=1104152 RepID=H0EZL3_GLAL7|nr:hypothetical protein M7I_8287 [Glarea lozoyensis 74030]